MKMPTERRVHFHGAFREKYSAEPLLVSADSMQNLLQVIFLDWFPDFLDEHQDGGFSLAFEDGDGNFTELFDPEQQLSESQKDIHILPNPDGAWGWIVYIIVAIVAAFLAVLLAPKMDMTSETTSGANWESPENVIGQGGIMPVLLGTRRCGSRVVSHGIASHIFRGLTGGGSGGGGFRRITPTYLK